MKKIIKFILLSLLVFSGYGAKSFAHTRSGSLGNAAGIADVFQVFCSTDAVKTDTLELKVINITPSSPLVSVQIQKGDLVENTTDAVSGDSNFSPTSETQGGNGGYKVTVDKAGNGAVKYSLDFHCLNGSTHTGTSIVALENDVTVSVPPMPIPEPDPTLEPIILPPTEVKGQAIEGELFHSAFVITHGCNNNFGTKKTLSVIAQSVVFPNGDNPDLFRIVDGNSIAINSLAGEIKDADRSILGLSPGVTQNKTVFKKQIEVTDSLGKVRSIVSTKGKMDINALGLVPFHLTAPSFEADSCVKSLQVRIAIANYCNKSQKINNNNRADIFMGALTSKFDDRDVMTYDFETEPYWPTLTVQRDLDSNPLNESCENVYDIAIQPSVEDIDNYLPIKRFWPK